MSRCCSTVHFRRISSQDRWKNCAPCGRKSPRSVIDAKKSRPGGLPLETRKRSGLPARSEAAARLEGLRFSGEGFGGGHLDACRAPLFASEAVRRFLQRETDFEHLFDVLDIAAFGPGSKG